MCGLISDGLRRAQADLRLARHFACADALEALIELRVNMLRHVPDTSHAEIDAAIDACLGPAAHAALEPTR